MIKTHVSEWGLEAESETQTDLNALEIVFYMKIKYSKRYNIDRFSEDETPIKN